MESSKILSMRLTTHFDRNWTLLLTTYFLKLALSNLYNSEAKDLNYRGRSIALNKQEINGAWGTSIVTCRIKPPHSQDASRIVKVPQRQMAAPFKLVLFRG